MRFFGFIFVTFLSSIGILAEPIYLTSDPPSSLMERKKKFQETKHLDLCLAPDPDSKAQYFGEAYTCTFVYAHSADSAVVSFLNNACDAVDNSTRKPTTIPIDATVNTSPTGIWSTTFHSCGTFVLTELIEDNWGDGNSYVMPQYHMNAPSAYPHKLFGPNTDGSKNETWACTLTTKGLENIGLGNGVKYAWLCPLDCYCQTVDPNMRADPDKYRDSS